MDAAKLREMCEVVASLPVAAIERNAWTLDRRRDAVEIARATLALLDEWRWRKCSEEMPGLDIPVLVMNRDGCVVVEAHRYEDNEIAWRYPGNEHDTEGWPLGAYGLWMPQPPEEQ